MLYDRTTSNGILDEQDPGNDDQRANQANAYCSVYLRRLTSNAILKLALFLKSHAPLVVDAKNSRKIPKREYQ